MAQKSKKLIRIDEVREVLSAKPSEVERWVNNGDIPICEHRGIRKYGRHLNVRMFDPAVVTGLVDKIAKWRVRDDAEMRRRRSKVAKSAAEKASATRLLNTELRSLTGISDYAASFPLARQLGRRLLFLCGPTNSGKTHKALQLVASVATAEILSPLRLLAMEHFDTLTSRGLSASMITGEEIIGDETASHISRTVECADFSRIVEVGLIDEVQLLDDRSRGWAWTAAAFGLPAKTLVMTGSPEALPLVQRIAEMTGEALEVINLTRLGKLEVMNSAMELTEVKKGDAIIVFSRNDLNKVRKILSDIGEVNSAAIYGALGPEVRRTEAARFASGEADVLVATDAVGMGLNLPIQRVLFTTTRKFDGEKLRDLTIGEINQIAGRAGRFGNGGRGQVGIVELPDRTADRRSLSRALDVFQPSLRTKFLFRPSIAVVARAGIALNTTSLVAVMTYLQANLARGSNSFELADTSDIIDLGLHLDGHQLTLEDKFLFACSPCETRSDVQMRILCAFAREHSEGRQATLPKFPDFAHAEALEDFAKAASLYLWLARKFPETFAEVAQARALRTKAQDELSRITMSLGQVNETLDEEKRGMVVLNHLSPPRFRDRYGEFETYGYEFDDDDEDDHDFDVYRKPTQVTAPKNRKRKSKKKNKTAPPMSSA
jgi:ATP-dependent RNA helicase SUPV3L1/SUV3